MGVFLRTDQDRPIKNLRTTARGRAASGIWEQKLLYSPVALSNAPGGTMQVVLRGLRQSTVLGLTSIVIIMAAMALTVPQNILDFFNLSGLLVVVGGTVAATLVCRPITDVKRVVRRLPALAHDELPSINREIQQLLYIAEQVRHGYIRAAEEELTQVQNAFLRSGLQMVLDRSPPEDIAKVMRWRMEGLRSAEATDVQILRTMASFAPALGMLGTLFGLVHMLHDLGSSDLTQIGSAMAFALMTTLYGIVAANLFFKPLAMKMERRTQQQLAQLALLQEGILMIYERQHPMLIKETLAAFMVQHQQIFDRTTTSPLLKAA